MTPLLAAIALIWAPLALAQSASDRVEGAAPDEVEAFRKARDRFDARMEEVDADTRAYVDMREDEERTKLVGGFDGLIADLESSERQQRELAIQRFETFLLRYPDVRYASHVRFRLADLFFERASEEWQLQAEEYFSKVEDETLSIEELESLGEQPTRDLSKPVALYLKIIEDNQDRPPEERYERLDGTYVMLGFVYNDPNNDQHDPEKAKQSFADLIATMPESDLADRSHLFLGNFAFADNEFDEAIAAYEAVYEKGDESKYYMEGLYQLAWGRYKLNEFDEALRLFTELLDLSEQQKLDTGRESAFAPDAKRFLAFSFADLGYDQDRDAQIIAKEYFAGIGGRAYERDVYEQLADVLIRYTRPEEAIATYKMLQNEPQWLLEPDGPEHQIAMIGLYQTSVARDLEIAGSERLVFIDRYSEGTEWWDANRNDPEALDRARTYIEASLLDVAIEYRVQAQESGQASDFALAATKYQEYLDKFPISDDYYKQQWYLADTLKLAGNYEGALSEFDSLIRSQRYHPYGDASLYSSMDVRYQEMVAKGHAPDLPPEGAPVEEKREINGKVIEVYGLSDDRMAFINAADNVVSHKFSAPADADLPDFRQQVADKRASLTYIPAQMYFHHNRFEEARPRLEEVIEKYPRSVEANYAAGLLVDTYLAEGDLAQVRAYTKKFTVNPPGPVTEIDPERFKGTLEGTTFKLAMELAETDDNIAAAEAFVAFRKEFPNSEFDADALYNGAFYYQQAGKVEKSNELYEQFVAENPGDERSKGLFFRIAANYEAAFELDLAADYYDRLLDHPDATEAERADAQFNRSFLLIGLGRHRDAALGFEAYEKEYPDQEDKEDILWLAGEQWEEVGTDEATDFYKRFLRKYPDENADHVIESQYRLLDIYRTTGAEDWRIRKQNEAILETFDRFAKAGEDIGANGHRYAAAADFPRLEKLFEEYNADELTGNEDRDGDLINSIKPGELKAFESEIKAFIAKYQNFEYNSGALLLQARAALYLGDLGLSIQCPKSMPEEDCWLYEDILQDKVFPQFYAIEDVGIRRLSELVEAARVKKRHSRFIDEALVELNNRRPSEFPAVKEELEGGTDSTIPVNLTPLTMDPPSEGGQ